MGSLLAYRTRSLYGRVKAPNVFAVASTAQQVCNASTIRPARWDDTSLGVSARVSQPANIAQVVDSGPLCVSDVCPYTSLVIATDECPKRSATPLDVHAALKPRHRGAVPQRMHTGARDPDALRGDLDDAKQVARIDRLPDRS
jgi:hypothetical protein